MAKRSVLGKGLEALIPQTQNEKDYESLVELMDIDKIYPNEDQPRKNINEKELQDLSNSIIENGLIQPIVVSPIKDGKYEIVVGERRWRASKLAKLKQIECIVKEYNETEKLTIALIENIQRENLNPVELANGYSTLIKKLNYTQEELSKVIGKSRSSIANTMRLINLPQILQDDLIQNKFSEGHARCFIGIEDIEIINKLRNLIISEGLSVRKLEKLTQLYNQDKKEFDRVIQDNLYDSINDNNIINESSEKENTKKLSDKKDSKKESDVSKKDKFEPPMRTDYSGPNDKYDFVFPTKNQVRDFYTYKSQGFGFLTKEEAHGYKKLLEENFKLKVDLSISQKHKESDIFEYKGSINFNFNSVEEFYSLIYSLLTRSKRNTDMKIG